MSALTALWRGVLVVFGCAAALRAQEQTFVHEVNGEPVCVVRCTPYGGASASGASGLGFVVVQAENRDARPCVVTVAYESHDWDNGSVAARRSFVLGAQESAQFALPLPGAGSLGGLGLVVTIDGVRHGGGLPIAAVNSLAGLLIAERADAQPWSLTVMQSIRRLSSDPPEVRLIAPDLVPADWRLFTGFHAVVVDGRARVPAPLQEALRRFVFAGGTVIVGAADRLPSGALRDLVSPLGDDGVKAYGVGYCAAVTMDGDTTLMRSAIGELPQHGLAGWPAPEPLLQQQEVPGLGQAPVLVFLFVILVFAFVVGPVNFVVLKRSRRPLLLLATLPACGLGTTLVMFGYGFLSDGIGTRGTVRSWTLLDQQRHEGACFAARTLFAGLSPRSFHVGADSVLIAPWAFVHRERRAPDRWEWDAQENRLDGGVLPSRRPTPLLSAQQGVIRERLRARITGDRLELLGDGGVALVGEVVLRETDGTWWWGAAPMLSRATEEEGRKALARWVAATGPFVVDDGSDGGRRVMSTHGLLARLIGRDLAPGSYVGQVASAPWLDDHGVAVDYDAESHVVIGHFAPEDVSR